MAISSEHNAQLSHFAYDPPAPDDKGLRSVTLDGVKYTALAMADKPSGYQGVIFQREGTDEIIVAHRGTEFKEQFLNDVLRADGGMVAQRANAQAADAIEFTKAAIEAARERGVEVTVTGHSLGGCLAQVTAAKLGLRGETFNAYGAASLGMQIPEGGHQVVNHVMAADFVSSASHHFGEVKVYASRHDVKTLSLAGYANSDANLTDPRNFPAALGAGALSHSLHHFRNVDGDGRPDISVLRDPETMINAHRLEPMIDKFRGDVWAMREGASIGSAVLRGPMGIADEIGRHLPEKMPESPFKGAHGALPASNGRTPDPRQPTHPDHQMHQTLDSGVQTIYAQQGMAFDESGERTVAASLASAKLSGLERADHVVAGHGAKSGVDIFVVQGDLQDPAHRRAQVNTSVAAQIPVDTSFQQVDAVNKRQNIASTEDISQEQARTAIPRTA